ncbi:hypothetical protein, partial [Burkholderia cenocepacia]|uniref:hypothetical protein n=1 Tax=Burkholderia cenocepacia TaxID=95486 RepID=UPI001955338A
MNRFSRTWPRDRAADEPAACDAGVNDTRDRTNNDGGAGLRGRPISRSPFHRCARHAAGSDETSTYGKT